MDAVDIQGALPATYLADLAHGLRLPPARCQAIHRRLGTPLFLPD
jgi:hypothetical protein